MARKFLDRSTLRPNSDFTVLDAWVSIFVLGLIYLTFDLS